MRHILLLATLFLLNCGTTNAQRARTIFTGDFSHWTCEGLTYKTVFNNDWDNWTCDGTAIKTTFNEDWDSWTVGNEVTLKTTFFNDFDRWEIKGYGKTIKITTTFNDDTERWDVSGDFDGIIRTVFSGNYQTWAFDMDMDDLEEDLQKAIVFVAIFTSFRGQM